MGISKKLWRDNIVKGHFNGVGIIVGKLFNIINPHRAYFGQKDLQQFFIIKQLVKDLSFPVQLVRVPTVREKDGLAMSSRNRRLSPQMREKAVLIPKTLQKAGEMLKKGTAPEIIKAEVKELFLRDNDFQLEYFELADGTSLEIVE